MMVKAFTVYLVKDLKDEDADAVQAALSMVRGVLEVKPHEVESWDGLEQARARRELGEKLWEVLYPKDSQK